MIALDIEATKSTPGILFDQERCILRIYGESYPENAAKFYSPVVDWLREYLAESGRELRLEFEIIYFNSSSSKVFMNLFDLLEAAVTDGRQAAVVWRCDAENETAIECGEEFREDVVHLPFEIQIVGG